MLWRTWNMNFQRIFSLKYWFLKNRNTKSIFFFWKYLIEESGFKSIFQWPFLSKGQTDVQMYFSIFLKRDHTAPNVGIQINADFQIIFSKKSLMLLTCIFKEYIYRTLSTLNVDFFKRLFKVYQGSKQGLKLM